MLVAAALLSGGVFVGDLARVVPALADTWPSTDVAHPATVTADALPTVQINGVAWTQEVVGNTVYVGGKFTTARPAGSAPGANETPRINFLAYDLTTGELIASVALAANAQVRSIQATPDGSRIYVGGDFTTFGGQPRNRLAAIDTATNTLVPTFAPNVGFHVYDVTATNDTVYIGGNFLNVGVQVRERLAAFSANGALLSWAPSAPDREVWSVQISPDGSKVAIGGQFETFNGSTTFGRGLVMVDAVTGATLPFAAAALIRNGGAKGAITSITTDGDLLYGSGYTYGGLPSGNLEGSFAADWDGNLVWVSDCHGDTYSLYATGDVVYAASHSHYCGNIGGFGESSPQQFYRGTAFSKAVAGTIATERLGYYNFAGEQRPDLLNFFPSILPGTFTGQGQGPWSVDGDSRYVVYGGEFPSVNGTAQQGLVRFQVRPFATNLQGPTLFNATYPIAVQSLGAGSVTVSWRANQDRDDATLRYTVFRRTGTTGQGVAVHTRTATAPFWNRPTMTFTDTTAVPGATYQYRVQVTDGSSNFANSNWRSVTAATTGAHSAYLAAVLASEPDAYWRFGEGSGANAPDLVGSRTATQSSSGTVTWNQAGAVAGDADTAALFSGATGRFFRTTTSELPTHVFSLEAWFNTATTANGGLIAGWNQSNTANSGAGSTVSNDRNIYMDASGRVYFGLEPDNRVTITSDRNYRDNQWHHVVGTLGDDGMRFYVDGVLIGHHADVQWARTGYYGFVRIGGGALNGYPNANTTTGRWFDGAIDEVALYNRAVTAADVVAHYEASGRVRDVPADEYGASTVDLAPSFYWRLGEAPGATTAADASPQGRSGTYQGAVALGATGVLDGVTDTAATFDGTTSRVSATGTATAAPQVYTGELWFNTTTTSGGKLLGFGDQSGAADSAAYDRHVYMQDDGRLVFGTNTPGTTTVDQDDPGHQNVITTAESYNDGQWHQVVATQSAAGLHLYVDGLLVGTNPAATARDYVGFWRVGGDPTWGSTSGYFYGVLDEVAVYPVALDASAVFDRFVLGSGTVPNILPTASFTSSVLADGQTVAVDGTSSSDADGTIVDWTWNFGDGSPDVSGATPLANHTYAVAGTYTVTLRVTDDDGDTHQAEGEVATLGPNTAPLAALTVAITGRDVSFDATASSDADGTISDWSWNFGDGSPIASGSIVSHTYAVAGPYAVILTVTDNRGGTHQITHELWANDLPAVPPPPVSVLAADAFERTLTNAFGAADVGGNWSLSAATGHYSVPTGTGRIRMANPGSSPAAYLESVSSTSSSLRVDLSFEKTATGGGVYSYLIGRRIGTTGDYRAIVRYQSNGTVQATLTRRSGSADTTLASVNPVPGLAMAPRQAISARLQIVGTNPTQLSLKLWQAGTAEPTGWLLTTTDATASHQAAGSVGLGTYLSGSATNAPNFANYDDLVVGDPSVPVNATPTARFSTVADELVVDFDGSITVDDGTIVSWSWDFGDDTLSDVGPAIQHAYAEPGTYPVTLTVIDDQGASSQVTLNVIADTH